MSRILEALQQIETSARGDASAPLATGATAPPPPDTTVAAPASPPPETQIVCSLDAALAQPDDGRADPIPDPQFGRLADLVLEGLPPGRNAVLMLTSPGTGDGKTRVTAALAKAIAAQGAGEVLAVDADYQCPHLAARLMGQRGGESSMTAGLAEVLAGEAVWRSSVRPTPWKRLDVLPGTKTAAHQATTVAADLGTLFEQLRCHYQVVLLDGPSAACPETMLLARHCDGVFVVVKLGHTGRRAARHAVSLLQNGGVRLLGCVALDA